MDELSSEHEFDYIREVLAALDDQCCEVVIMTTEGWRPHQEKQ